MRQSLVAKSQNFIWLSAFIYFHLHLSCNGRNLYRTAKYGCGQVEHKIVDKVATVANEFFVRLFFDKHNEVACDTAIASGIAFTTNGKLHSVFDTCRDIDRYYLFGTHYSLAAAVPALIGDDSARTVTRRTVRLCLHRTKYSPLYLSNYATTSAGGTRLDTA